MGHFDYDVFLSFASSNESLARPLWEQLSHSGLRVFWSDESLKENVGEGWYDVIEKSLESSKHMVLLWTPDAKRSGFVKKEYQAFDSELAKNKAKDRYLIPVFANGILPNTLPLFLRGLQGYPLEGELRELIERLGGHYEPLREANARLLRELNQAKAENEKLLEQLEAEKSKGVSEENEALKSALDSLKEWEKKYAVLEERHKAQEGDFRRAQSEIKPMQIALKSERQRVSELKNEKKILVGSKDKEIQRLRSDVAKKGARIQDLQSDLERAIISTGGRRPRFSLGSGMGGAFIGVLMAGILSWVLWGGGNSQGDLPVAAGAQGNSADSTAQVPDSVARHITRDNMDFVYIPPGEFMMGSEDGRSNERPVHKVVISKGFYLGKTEVTQAQWEAVMGSNPSSFRGPLRPVERVSWNRAQEFIRRLNEDADCNNCYRLPTEAEWEYAARAGSTTKYSFGDSESLLENYGWYRGNAEGETHAVAVKDSSNWGLYDMHGNVWEWVEDWYGSDYYRQSRGWFRNKTAVDPIGPENGTYRVIRGGGWSYYAPALGSAYRNYRRPGYAYGSIGFRLLRTIP